MSSNPYISIVITAHNAEETIRDCLQSIISNKELKSEEYEIILVDDRSQDRTSEVALALGLNNLILLRIDQHADQTLTARQVALDCGFKRAFGEIIMVTDADALVPSNWISQMKEYFNNSCSGVAGLISFRGSKIWIKNLQNLDSLFYFTFNGFLNSLGFRSGIFLGNFAFRKDIYFKLGGFEKLGFALTEDLLLAEAMSRYGSIIRYEPESVVTVVSCKSLKELIKRTIRVSSGKFFAFSYVSFLWMISFIIFIVLALGGSVLILKLLLIRFGLGVGIISVPIIKLRRFRLLFSVPFYEIFVIVLGLIVLLRLQFTRKIKWGNINYER
jgi:cellulose synthase/poly-beta-1,6-N-acetylglucosamine synthase-like glycosyltransferase